MKTHYIPKLFLKQFSTFKKVNSYDFITSSFATKKLKNTFSDNDIFDEELELAFATKLEGPFGNLLNNKLLKGNLISIERKENLLMRKFLMINALRAPIVNTSWDEMVERTKSWNHPSVQAREFLSRHNPEMKEMFDSVSNNKESYIPNLKKAMEIENIEDIADSDNRSDVSLTLKLAARHAMVTVIAFWDCEKSGQEFILPKLPGISQMDNLGIFYKLFVLKGLLEEKKKQGLEDDLRREIERLIYGTIIYMENFSIYPLSPTRIMICFAPYFRAFFSIIDPISFLERYPPLLKKELFNQHFFELMRMELFKPCKTFLNKFYQYSVKELTAQETQDIIFHNFNKIRDSFWYYEHKSKFVNGKKHDFSRMI